MVAACSLKARASRHGTLLQAQRRDVDRVQAAEAEEVAPDQEVQQSRREYVGVDEEWNNGTNGLTLRDASVLKYGPAGRWHPVASRALKWQ